MTEDGLVFWSRSEDGRPDPPPRRNHRRSAASPFRNGRRSAAANAVSTAYPSDLLRRSLLRLPCDVGDTTAPAPATAFHVSDSFGSYIGHPIYKVALNSGFQFLAEKDGGRILFTAKCCREDSCTDAATEIASFPSFEGHIGETKVLGDTFMMPGRIKLFLYSRREIGEKLSELGGRLDYPLLTKDIAQEIEALWKDPAVQETYSRGNELQVPDCAYYFMENLHRFSEANYVPTKHACILCILLDFMWKSKAVLKLCEANKGVYVKAGQFVAAVRARKVPKEYSLLFQCLQS